MNGCQWLGLSYVGWWSWQSFPFTHYCHWATLTNDRGRLPTWHNVVQVRLLLRSDTPRTTMDCNPHHISKYGTHFRHMAPYGTALTIQNHMEPYGTIWHRVPPYGTIWQTRYRNRRQKRYIRTSISDSLILFPKGSNYLLLLVTLRGLSVRHLKWDPLSPSS